MRQVNVQKQSEEEKFARLAAVRFSESPEMATFSEKPPAPGDFVAVRWGLCDDGVLVLKLDPAHDPANYIGLVKVVEK